jgi:23S rRNA G2445 N2-methylase RlmL
VSGKVVLKKKRRTLIAPEISETLVTCPGGAEYALADELRVLGTTDPTTEGAAVRAQITPSDVPRLNREVRTGSRVLIPLARFQAKTFDEVYRGAAAVPWDTMLTPEHTFMITANSQSEALRDHRFLAMRVKDAIVDRQRKYGNGRRSSVDKTEPHLIVNVFAADTTVEIAIDSTGVPLHQRGYRVEAGDAPLRETVAAMMVLESGYRPGDTRQFLDPFCGSGTLVIEAALLYARRGPGTLGRTFAWQRWPWTTGEDRSADATETRGASGRTATSRVGTDAHQVVAGGPPLIGTDNDPRVIQIARRNAERAGVADLVRFEVAEVGQSLRHWTSKGSGVIVTNPPYGVRLQPEGLSSLYSDLGEVLREYAAGWEVTIIAADSRLVRHTGLRPAEHHTVFNGALACQVNRYRVYRRDTPRSGKE